VSGLGRGRYGGGLSSDGLHHGDGGFEESFDISCTDPLHGILGDFVVPADSFFADL
jgi:hypothetical protein